jgi:para-nitrobenzyl esterase
MLNGHKGLVLLTKTTARRNARKIIVWQGGIARAMRLAVTFVPEEVSLTSGLGESVFMGLRIETASGAVEGTSAKGVKRWLGIPYAAAERFGLPQPVPRWSGVRAAEKLGAELPQAFGAMMRIEEPAAREDALLLNIYAPDNTNGKAKPVMFWIHGGAFITGSGNPYDGTDLATRGDMIVVTINYRLGVLGFVNFADALGMPQIPTNLGLRDQIAALRWVKDNIAAFGGDPNRVTISGESAGSMSVSMLMLAPEAWPYFHGAIMQSGAVSLIHSREKSIEVARRYLEILDLRQGDLDRLRALPLKTLFAAQAMVQKGEAGTIPAAPWFDGALLPASLAGVYNAPTANVPLIAGSNREEIRLFEWMPGPRILPMKRTQAEPLLREQLGREHAERILATYPNTKNGNRALATQLAFGMPTINFAERQSKRSPTWLYRFDYSHFLFGAAHAIDLAYLWNLPSLAGTFVRGGAMTGKRRELTRRMQDHWGHFVREGRPGDDWPGFDTTRHATKLFNLDDQVVDDPDAPQRSAWAGVDVSPGMA